ncbi:MAG: hydrogenase expression/formation protein [Notoacmeibacter sp.]|nr:hydrogenase expression/formation protein [Notoacmeibacter sp.]
MTHSIPGLVGPNSQPGEDDGAALDLFPMPSGMMTFSTPNIPEPEEAAGMATGIAVLERVLGLLRDFDAAAQANAAVDLAGLDPANLDLVNQVLGEGEVSIIGGVRFQAQEAVLAGVWRVRETGETGSVIRDTVEAGLFPKTIAASAFSDARDRVAMPASLGPNVFNAPPLVAEINEHLGKPANGTGLHVINLSLLPHTEEDLTFLNDLLGRGGLTILSRGYGNCRITASATRNVWWVQYYNSQDSLILNSIEITGVPEVACASLEDIADSADRLNEILEIYR